MNYMNRDIEDVSREIQAFLNEGQVPAPLYPQGEEAARRIGLHLEGTGPLRSMTLPPKWEIKLETVVQTSTIVGTIYDERGYPRAEFQYRHKDSCGTEILCRFWITYVEGHLAVVDRMANQVYFYVESNDVNSARNWLTQNHPEWEDPAAYW